MDVLEYNKNVDEYKRQSKIKGKPITGKELPKYNLPCVKTFIKYCPDSKVKSWNDFVIWCGLNPTNMISKEQASQLLIKLDRRLDRPIIRKDLTLNNAGISCHMVRKYWKNLRNCQEELGLKIYPNSNHQKSFNYYKKKLDLVIQDLKQRNKSRITWHDIIYSNVGGFNYNSLINAFMKEDINVVNYIQDNGLTFWKTGIGKENYYMFSDGETTTSSYEYDLSTFLRDSDFIYERDYSRNCLYKNILNIDLKQKIDCDYLFYDTFAVEIVGMLSNKNNDWHTFKCNSTREEDYLHKMIYKEKLFIQNNIPFLFLFPEDFENDLAFKPKVINFILSNLHKYKLIKK